MGYSKNFDRPSDKSAIAKLTFNSGYKYKLHIPHPLIEWQGICKAGFIAEVQYWGEHNIAHGISKEGWVGRSQERWAQVMGVSVRTLQRWAATLESDGLLCISTENVKGKKQTAYRLSDSFYEQYGKSIQAKNHHQIDQHDNLSDSSDEEEATRQYVATNTTDCQDQHDNMSRSLYRGSSSRGNIEGSEKTFFPESESGSECLEQLENRSPSQPSTSDKNQNSREDQNSAAAGTTSVTSSKPVDHFAQRAAAAKSGKHPCPHQILVDYDLVDGLWVGPRHSDWDENAIAIARERKRKAGQSDMFGDGKSYIANLVTQCNQWQDPTKLELLRDEAIALRNRPVLVPVAVPSLTNPPEPQVADMKAIANIRKMLEERRAQGAIA